MGLLPRCIARINQAGSVSLALLAQSWPGHCGSGQSEKTVTVSQHRANLITRLNSNYVHDRVLNDTPRFQLMRHS